MSAPRSLSTFGITPTSAFLSWAAGEADNVGGGEFSSYQLAAGHYEPEVFPMTAIAPRPDSETGSFISDTVLARYRWAYFDGTNPVRYELALKIFGGSAPHMFELISGPPGMTVGNDRNPANHGVVKWTPQSAYSAGSPASVSVRVHGQDGNTIDLNWTIQTTSSTDKFMFLDADDGNDSTGDGSFNSPFKTLYKVTGATSSTVTFPNRIVYLRGSTANYTTVAHTNSWMPNNEDTIPARIALKTGRHPLAFVAFPDETVTIDLAGAQFLTPEAGNDFFFSGSSTADLRILGSAVNAAERHNFWISNGHRGHFQWINFDGFVPRTAGGYTNSAPIFSVNGGGGQRQYWSAHAVRETNRVQNAPNDGLLWVLFNLRYWADDYCYGRNQTGVLTGPSFKDTCYQTSTRYTQILASSPSSGDVRFNFMGQNGSGNNEICYSKVQGPLWMNSQAGPGVGKMIEYRNTVHAVDTNYPEGIRAWRGSGWKGPFLSKNSVIQANGPRLVNSLVEVAGDECHARNSGGDQSIDANTLTLQNKSGGTQYRDLYLYLRGHEIG